MSHGMTVLKGFSLPVLFIAATWMSGCADDPVPPGTTPDSGPPLDVTSDSKLDTHSGDGDAPGSDADSASCPAPRALLYSQEGCGASAPAPVCLGVGDACSGTYCGCDGATIFDWCEGAQKPYAHRGACQDGGDASPDVDAANPDDVADASDAADGHSG